MEHIRKIFEAQPMMQTISAQLDLLQEGEAEISAPIGSGFLQHHGFAHAALTFALGDSAAGIAAMTLLPEGMAVVTSEISTHLLRPSKGERLFARGQVIKAGKTQIIARSEVFAQQSGKDVHMASLTGTMVPLAM